VPDRFDESQFRHVVLDPQVAPLYRRSFEEEYGPGAKRLKPLFPELGYYPALFENAEFVICPLSTMLVEAAIFEKRVIAIAYDDGIHPDSPAAVVNYDHFEGIDRIEGFELCRRADDLGPLFRAVAGDPLPPRSLREQIGWWLFHDERGFAVRLRECLDEIAGAPAPAPLAGSRS
jgi:hypothetical protein